MVWREGLNQSGVTAAITVFWVQLVLNVLWSIIFFGKKSLFGGMALIIILWLAILITIILFFGVSAIAGGLLIPYIIWVSIATNLNIQVWRLNR
jgi:tryptophan-rich sensory protein